MILKKSHPLMILMIIKIKKNRIILVCIFLNNNYEKTKKLI